MCFHNSMTKKAIEVAARYRRKYWREVDLSIFEKYHVNAFANPECPVITGSEEIQAFEWGLIPFWVKPEHDTETDRKKAVERAASIRKGEYNARAETIFEKPSFRHSIVAKRCIIPSTGYFEYHHNEDGSATPYFINVINQDEGIFSMGGIWDAWDNPVTGKMVHTFSLITTPGNEFTNAIHNGGKNPFRMPLILSPEDEERWLDSRLKKPDIEKLLKPFDGGQMEAYAIGGDFLKKSPFDKSILKRA